MGLQSTVRNMLITIAGKLGLTVQDERQAQRQGDYLDKETDISFVDMMTGSLADTQCLDFTLPIGGNNQRALWLNDLADDFVNLKMVNTVQTTFNTGDSITVPFWNGRNIQNILIGAQDFVITKRFGDEITGVIYLADTFKKDSSTYKLLQAIDLEDVHDEYGNDMSINHYRLFVAKDDEPFLTEPGIVNPAWAEYERDWYIPGVDRLLIGRLKSNAINPKRPNSVKGVPICFGASKPIAELHYLYDQFHIEFVQAEAMVFADKTLFKSRNTSEKNPDGTPKKRIGLARGRNRVIQTVESNARNVGDQSTLPIKEYAPNIRYEAYQAAIQEQFKLFENCVGVSEGVVSRIDTSNYENVDNVRKSMRKTQSFINASRKRAEEFLEDLVYSWNVLANYYEITPPGDYDITYDWSDEYINTFTDRMTGLIQGEAVGAVGPVDIRAFLFNEPPVIAAEKVAEIRRQQTAGMVDDDFESVNGGSILNNIQT